MQKLHQYARPRNRPVVLDGGPPPDLVTPPQQPDGVGLSTSEQVAQLDKRTDGPRRRINRLQRVVTGAASAIQERWQRKKRRYRVAMVTVTYRPGIDWQPDHISKLMQHYRMWLKRRGYRQTGIWVMELQRRGAPHYHILLWLPRGITPPKPDKQGWWPHGMSNCTFARKAVGYAAKYASKLKSKDGTMPKGARLYGVFGSPIHLGWYRAPAWLRERGKPGEIIKRIKGGWWVNESIGWAWRSPWMLDWIQGNTIQISWRGWSPSDCLPLYFLSLTWEN